MVDPFYSLEMDIGVDLETITTEEEALTWSNRFLPDLYALLKRHARGQHIHVSFKLDHEILEYEWIDGVGGREKDQQEADDRFVEKVRKAQEIINAGDDHGIGTFGDRD